MEPALETPRLLLRPFAPADRAGYFFLNHVPETCWLGGERKHRLATGRLACIDKVSGQLVGCVGLRYLPDLDVFDIGYRINQGFEGLGYASEACKAMVDYCHARDALNAVVALVKPDNLASVRVLRKCGFVYDRQVVSTLLEYQLDLYRLP